MFKTMFANTPKLVKQLLYINVAVYFFAVITKLFDYDLSPLIGLVPYLVINKFFVWQFLTYMFVHLSPVHLFFNLLMLWMFGSELCRLWGNNFFLKFYFICGIGGGLAVVALSFLEPASVLVPTIGASGAIFGLFLAYGVTYKDRLLYVFGIVPVKAKILVTVLGLIEFLSLLSESNSSISHLAHLGGLVTAYIYLKLKEKEKKLAAKRYNQWKEKLAKKKLNVIYTDFEKDKAEKRKSDNITWN